MRGLFVPWLTTLREAVTAGRLPLWDQTVFAGYPFFANPQVGIFYPPAWLALILPPPAAVGWYVALHLIVAGAGMMLFLRRLEHSTAAAGIAGLAFAFSGFAAARIYAGHIGLLATLSWTPWVLLALHWAVDRRRVTAALVAAVPVGLAVLAGHTTSLLYAGLAGLAFAIYLALENDPLMVGRQAVVMGAAGVAVAAVQAIPLAEFSLRSARAAQAGFEFATQFSLPPAHLITLIVPEFFGEPTRAGYWSVPNFEELTLYAGMLPLLGVALAAIRPNRRVWLWLAVIALGLLLALGSYGFLFRVFYDLLPPFRLARAPGRASFLWIFGASALLATAIDGDPPPSSARWVLIVGAGLGAAALAATGTAFAAQHPTATSGRLWHQTGGWALAIGFFAISGIVLLAALRAEDQRRRAGLMALLAALLIADLWTFGMKFTRLDPLEPAPLWRDAAQVIPADAAGRVIPWGVSIFEQNGVQAVGLNSVFGYNALEVGSVQQLLGSIPDPRAASFDVVGARWVISGAELGEYFEGDQPLTLVGQTGFAWVYERGRVLPLARIVTAAEVIDDDAAAVARLHAPDFDPAATAILDQQVDCLGGTPGTAEILERRDGYWRISVESDGGGLLVLAETDYPGWQVRIDGQTAEALTAYTAVRAVCVPPGQHTVDWVFRPVSLYAGAGVSLAMLGLIAASARRESAVHSTSTGEEDEG
ncbi:MAG: hypothetical protein ACFB51_05740 [Anaerolineae bacterium]